jgi:small ligand-binding sensory domain FIST
VTAPQARVQPQIFAHAHAAGSDWRQALKACGDALAAKGASGALGLVYVTEPWATHLGDMATTLQERLGVSHWAGCVGFGIFAGSTEYQREPAMSVMVASVAAEQVSMLEAVLDEDRAKTFATTPWCRMNAPVFGLLHADPRNPHVEAMVVALMSDDVGGGYVVGGLTPVAPHPLQVADGTTAGGLSGVLLAASVPVAVALSQGCSPIGPLHTITSGRRGMIAELDGRPALEVLKADVGEVLARDLRRIAGYIHVALPVSGADVRDYTVRNLMGLDSKSGVIAIGADVNAGDKIFFVRRDPASAQKDFARVLQDLKKRIGARRILGGHYVSCVARGPQMFGEAGGEARMIAEALGEFPLTGFFANGEICGTRMYGYTGVLSVFLDQAL